MLRILSLPGVQNEILLRKQETALPSAMPLDFVQGLIEKSEHPPRFRLLTVKDAAPIIGAWGMFDCPRAAISKSASTRAGS
jgi:hypothetical protein